MRQSLLVGAAVLTLFGGLAAGAAMAHNHPDEAAVSDGDLAKNRHLLHDQSHESDLPDGHVPPNVNYGFEMVGQDTLGGISDGKYTDVWGHKGYAYVGTFEEPTCDRSGVFVSDIRDPANPTTVTMIKSPPNTRINDVKVHEIGRRDILIFTLEKCGPLVGGNSRQKGQGGISLWDVTNPVNPHALKQNFLDFQVHNTFPWTTEDGNTYLLIVDDENLNDTHIADITKPQSPKLIATTGIGDWLDDPTNPVGEDGQLATGVFAASLLHDIWVEQINGRWIAVLSYWDAGFITLDVTDPFSPIFIKDSTYPDPDPVLGNSPAEGNGHAAVFGGTNSSLIFAGDEDFDSLKVTVKAIEDGAIVGTFNPTQGSDVPQVGSDTVPAVAGGTVFVGQACTPSSVPTPMGGEIALIERGTCAFTTKAQNVQAAGYITGIVFNQPGRNDGQSCEVSISMLVSADIPMLFLARSAGFALLGIGGYDPAQCSDDPTIGDGANPALPTIGTAGLFADISADFDGWGYFHVLNNLLTGDSGDLEELGYYAPAEVADPVLATGAGDLTMHNVIADPRAQDVTPTMQEGPRAFISWYSLGMRAVEYRPGHFHDNTRGEGVFSQNVHEVGRWIAEDGSNFWGVDVTEIDSDGDGQTEQYILGSDRNTGLWIFQFVCGGTQPENEALYCAN